MSSVKLINKRVLVVPLNWGLGHATRMIPVINYLRVNRAMVYVGGSPEHLSLFHEYFPGIHTVNLPYLKIRLSGRKSQIFSIMKYLPSFMYLIYKEHRQLNKIVTKLQLDAVISDNSYGLWHPKITSVFVTHQVNIKLPQSIAYLNKLVNKISHSLIRKFSVCWIPDYPDKRSIAGELSKSRGTTFNTYIGILSRFRLQQVESKKDTRKLKLLIILSGPENQRSIFEQKIQEQLVLLPESYDYNLIRGLPRGTPKPNPEWINSADSSTMQQLITEADCIICRSGYSTIMDLLVLGKTAVLVPTPGQTEQEYLAEYLERKNYFTSMHQEEFNLISALTFSENIVSETNYAAADDLLNSAMSDLFK